MGIHIICKTCDHIGANPLFKIYRASGFTVEQVLCCAQLVHRLAEDSNVCFGLPHMLPNSTKSEVSGATLRSCADLTDEDNTSKRGVFRFEKMANNVINLVSMAEEESQVGS